jgi:hypothetical protein
MNKRERKKYKDLAIDDYKFAFEGLPDVQHLSILRSIRMPLIGISWLVG